MNVTRLSVDALAAECAAETEKFAHRQPSDTGFCFELLRRALADGLTEAFTRVYQVYERQVLSWVYRYPRFIETGESADYFVNAAFSQFYFGVRGPKFARFTALAPLLMYLKQCVHTAIALYLRDQQQIAALSIEDEGDSVEGADREQEAQLEQGTQAADVWALIRGLLPDDRDRLLARCVFALNMKPSEIVAAYPGRFSHEREISVALYRIRHLLRGNAALRSQLGLAPTEAVAARNSE